MSQWIECIDEQILLSDEFSNIHPLLSSFIFQLFPSFSVESSEVTTRSHSFGSAFTRDEACADEELEVTGCESRGGSDEGV
ncbi:MAG: hypothetical protein QOJ64_3262 [Acidobacteriota bacterium]|jgi:hypothetical protein|nr:hypothetical protein [Acidobacteriota bacterium]